MSEPVKLLKGILKTSGWTQEQLASKLDVSFATLNSWVHGRTKPRGSAMDRIRRLYLAQDVTGGSEPIYITLVNAGDARVGDHVVLEKDHDNDFDDEAIKAYILDEGMDFERDDIEIEPEDWTGEIELKEKAIEIGPESESYGCIPIRQMHVANSVRTVVRGTRSAGRIYDCFGEKARAQVIFVLRDSAIARIVEWDFEEKG